MIRLPVLTFHSICPMRSPVAFDAGLFGRLMTRLASAGWKTVRAGEAVAFARGQPASPPRSFVITFDDGYASVLREAAPILAAHRFRAILFVSTGLVGRSPIFAGDGLCPNEPALTWAGLRELVESGFEIGSHACAHRRLTTLSDDDLERELTESRSELESRLGVAVRFHAYPFGAVDSRVAAACARVYEGAFGTRLDWVTPGDDPAALPRLDAHYLRGLASRGRLDGTVTRAWIAVRRAGRAARAKLGGQEAGA
jgi:peptidoglycan/xylan/chitin deacetylase (PgdA/CDA1 family)